MNTDNFRKNILQINDAVSAHNFSMLDETTHKKILKWRNHPDTAKYSITKHITWDQHTAFVESLKTSEDKAYWLIKHHDKPVAVCNLYNIDHKSAFSGNNIIPGMVGYGVLANLVVQDLTFNKLDLSILYGEILPENKEAFRIAQFFDADWTHDQNGFIKTEQSKSEWLKRADKYAKLMNVFK